MKNTETLIVGFGMAAIPILRELQKTNNEYLIIYNDSLANAANEVAKIYNDESTLYH